MKRKNIKHQHGSPNPIIVAEENQMISQVDKALASSTNAQIIGNNGEIPLRNFLKRYLPYTLRAETGHFVTPSGELSPQIDIIILDSRYPLLTENEDSSIVAMLHSVLFAIEVKTNIRSQDFKKMWSNSVDIMKLAKEVPLIGSDNFGGLITNGFSYRAGATLNTLEKNYIKYSKPFDAELDLYLLRLHENDNVNKRTIGSEFHFEPEIKKNKMVNYFPTSRASYNVLSDLYYSLIQGSYYSIGARNYTVSDIGAQVMEYLSWSTCSWEDYYKNIEKK